MWEHNAENWIHHYPYILQAGRTKHQAPEGTKEDDVDAVIGELEEKDPNVDRLRALNEDAPFGTVPEGEEGSPPWKFKVVGDPQKYTAGDDGEVSYNAMVISSLNWPGHVTVAKGKAYQNLYFGYGLKTGGVCINPVQPPDVQDDPPEKKENPEPTPLEAPPEPLEPDTNKEEGEGEGGD